MSIHFIDVEADGLLEGVTKIHCVCTKRQGDSEIISFTERDIQDFSNLFIPGDTCVYHSGYGYDLPLLEKFGINWGEGKVEIVDTLALSREWWPECPRGHSLDAWGKFFGIVKPKVTDWDNLPIEEYVNRCSQDVLITERVYEFLLDKMGVET